VLWAIYLLPPDALLNLDGAAFFHPSATSQMTLLQNDLPTSFDAFSDKPSARFGRLLTNHLINGAFLLKPVLSLSKWRERALAEPSPNIIL